MAAKEPTPEVPAGAMEDFKNSAIAFSAELFEFVSGEINRAVVAGKVSLGFEDKLKGKLEAWRDEAVVEANDEFQRLYRREVNVFTTFFKGKLKKKIVKPESREVYIKRLKAINDVANNVFTTTMETVEQAALTSMLLSEL